MCKLKWNFASKLFGNHKLLNLSKNIAIFTRTSSALALRLL